MPITTQLKDSDTLVIAFPGYGRKLGLPLEEFFEAAGFADASRIVIIDDSRLKTINGLEPEFDTFDDMIKHLRGVIEEHGFRRVVTTGTSGGAYTAILIGHLLKVDHVVAFSPYPYLSWKRVRERGDPMANAWGRILEEANNLPEELTRLLDLGDVIDPWNGKTEYAVHVSRHNVWDFKRAQYLVGLPHLRVITHAYNRHALSGMLYRRGALGSCFRFPYRRSHLLRELFCRIKYGLRKDRDDFADRYGSSD